MKKLLEISMCHKYRRSYKIWLVICGVEMWAQFRRSEKEADILAERNAMLNSNS